MHDDDSEGPIRWRMHIPAGIDAVFRALTTDDGRAAYWAESAVQEGDHIAFVFANGLRHRATILAVERPSRFSLLYFGATTTFHLAPSDRGGTDLLLVCESVPAREWTEVHAGWLNVLFPLKAAVGFGIDLRNHDPARTWDAGYADG